MKPVPLDEADLANVRKFLVAARDCGVRIVNLDLAERLLATLDRMDDRRAIDALLASLPTPGTR